ncbi:protein-L-isoaspartate (D-aspartate) O-methyltransferase [Aureococcus anophagefferens]|nr:protein-L-isoaspartate (D-aspartate) O-methyltransferase [Aureococcus anophagefferens]
MLRRTLLLLSAQPVRSWMSSAFSNDGLVAALVRDGAIELPETAAALRRVDRRNFARAVGDPSALEDAEVYRDAPLPIGPLATISAPHMHARCLDLLAPPLLAKERAGAASRVLDNVDRDAALARAVGGRVAFSVGDGWRGHPAGGPYDAIHVGAAASEIPTDLLDQLAVGGRMIVPVGARDEAQALVQIDRRADGSLDSKTLFGVRYVELVSEG